MNSYGTETTEQHTLSGRLIPLAEAMFLAIGRASGRPAQERKYSVVLPVWAHNLCDKLTTTIFKSMVEMAPRDNKFVARHYGRLVGVVLRGVVFYFKEVPAKLKAEGLWDMTEEREKKVEAASGLPMLFSVASQALQKPITSGDELAAAGLEKTEEKAKELSSGLFEVLRYLLDRPVQEQYEFLQGIPEGFKSFLNFDGGFAGDKRRLEIYLVLAMYWPEIVEMEKEESPKTRKFLLEWLEKEEDKQLCEDPKVFYAVCDEIGLDLATPGHPFGSSPT